MTPINIEVVMPMLTSLEFGCSKCSPVFNQLDLQKDYRSSCTDEYPEDWRREAAAVVDALRGLSALYRHRIRFKLIDAQSPLGLWKQIRHRAFKVPTFIVDNKYVCCGCDQEKLESLIDRGIHEASVKIRAQVERRAENRDER